MRSPRGFKFNPRRIMELYTNKHSYQRRRTISSGPTKCSVFGKTRRVARCWCISRRRCLGANPFSRARKWRPRGDARTLLGLLVCNYWAGVIALEDVASDDMTTEISYFENRADGIGARAKSARRQECNFGTGHQGESTPAETTLKLLNF